MKFLTKILLVFIIIFAITSGIFQWLSALQFERGKNFYKKQDWYNALTAFQYSQKFFSRDPEVYRWLAKTYIHLVENRNPQAQLDLLKKAESNLLTAISIEPEYPYYWALLGRVSEELEKRGATPKKSALDAYHQATILDPNNPLFLELLAKFLIQEGKPDKAKPLIAKIVKIDLFYVSDPLQLWLENNYSPLELIPVFENDIKSLAKLLEFLNAFRHYDAVLLAGEKAIQMAPGDPEAIMVYASALMINKNCEKLESVIAPLLKNRQYEEKARRLMLSCFQQTAQYEAAEKEYLNLIALQPESVEYRYGLSLLYLFRRQPNLAKAHLLWLFHYHGLKDQNIKSRVILNLAQISENEKNFPQAFKFYQLYSKMHPEDKRIKAKVDELKAFQTDDIIYSPWDKDEEPTDEKIYPPLWREENDEFK